MPYDSLLLIDADVLLEDPHMLLHLAYASIAATELSEDNTMASKRVLRHLMAPLCVQRSHAAQSTFVIADAVDGDYRQQFSS
jgi:hypothetical protein